MQKLHIVWVGLLLFTFFVLPFHADAEEELKHNIMISEIQTASLESAGEEFIELYNPTDQLIELKNYAIEYKSSSGSTWFTKVAFDKNNMIQPRGFYLISSYELIESIDMEHSLRLAASGGHLRLIKGLDNEEVIIDVVGWGSADSPESESAPAADKGESITRWFDHYGVLIDTDNNREDFHILVAPLPQSSDPLETEEKNDDTTTEKKNYKAVHITELLADPEQPLTDNDDEFIELFNPHTKAINLHGYIVKTGKQFRYSYEFNDFELEARSYHVLRSVDTGLTLANTSGRAALFSPEEELLFATESYESAETGSSWSKFRNEWQWSVKTPGADNERQPIEEDASNKSSGQSDVEKGTESNRVFPKLEITELLIDPIAPKSDNDDEFIELFNPNDYPVDLADYVVKTGLPLRYKHTFEDGVINPGEYRTFYAQETGLTLANDDGMAALLGNDQEIFRTDPYESAPPGASWALINDSWHFTHSPTPGEENILKEDSEGKVHAASSNNSEPKEMSNEEIVNTLTQPASISQSRSGTLMVAGLVILAILYTVYEFRYDIQNRIELARRYLESRRGDRSEA